MSFAVAADAYDAFMGRFSQPLAVPFADLLSLEPGMRVLDVGAGPGALTGELVRRVGGPAVAAVDPMPAFVAALSRRHPEVDVRQAPAEQLPFDEDTFDATAAQLVVHFMADPVVGLHEMARVTRSGGRVAACVWDNAGSGSPLAVFWQAVRDIDPGAHDESSLAGSTDGAIAELMAQAGLRDVVSGSVSATVEFERFEDWWAPYLLGVGPAGDYVKAADTDRRTAVERRCAELLGPAPFEITAIAWSAVGIA